MPLLEAMHAFIKFAQAQDYLVCDFITFVKNIIVLNYTTCIIIWRRNALMNNSRHSWTSMKVLMISYSLHGG
jgi:hypothetical protein